jgi:hypothetical protein
MYKSNQDRLKSYIAERRIEEANADAHQDRLYEKIAEELGQEVQATALAKMAKRVVNKFGEDIQKPSLQMQTTGKPYTATDYLRQAIGEGKLSQIFDKIKNMDTTGLSKKEKVIVSDIKNKERRKYITDIFNERITPILEKKQIQNEKKRSEALTASKYALDDILDNVATAFVDVVGKGDESAVKKIVEKAIGRDRSETGMSDDGQLKVGPAPKSSKKKRPSRIELGSVDNPTPAGKALEKQLNSFG